jgi:hypothetical protein
MFTNFVFVPFIKQTNYIRLIPGSDDEKLKDPLRMANAFTYIIIFKSCFLIAPHMPSTTFLSPILNDTPAEYKKTHTFIHNEAPGHFQHHFTNNLSDKSSGLTPLDSQV